MSSARDWEAAYLAFETRDAEIRKFVRRLKRLGARELGREAQVLELFCGRGGGLKAWEELGFANLIGLDLSAALLKEYAGPARLLEADARVIPVPADSIDVVSIHGGLHHLATEADVQATLTQAHRVLRPGGRIFIVEPWPTPFLALAHRIAKVPAARRASAKLNAFARMVELEEPAYPRWLASGASVLAILDRLFEPLWMRRRLGKLLFSGRRRS